MNNTRVEFHLEDDFIRLYADKKPKWGPLGYITYKRTYSRSLNTIRERYRELANKFKIKNSEEWWLTCLRVVEGTYSVQKNHCYSFRLPWDEDKAQRSAQEMYRLMFEFKFLPPGRGLWMMGTDYVNRRGAAALNNCAYVSTDNLNVDFSSPFCFLMDMSMLGVGVGSDTKGACKVKILEPFVTNETVIVEDSREGWVNLLKIVLDAYSGKGNLPRYIDYSRIRKAGEPILGFGGIASGPEPLQELVTNIQKLLDSLIDQYVMSNDIVDIFNMIGKCVVAGNVRRSAEIMFGDPDDDNFLRLKDPKTNLDKLQSHRWASNNSVWGKVGMDYYSVAELTALNGEPGYEWLDNARMYGRMGRDPDYSDMNAAGGNPCLEQTLESYELCCLVETFPSRHDTYEEFQRTLKFAYLYAKTVTLMHTHNFKTNSVLLRNRRIGTSMSGIVQAFNKFGRRIFLNWCDSGYRYLRKLDDTYSRWLCVPKSIKITSVKPSGTVSLLPGVTPGIHYPHSEYYYRTIRFATNSRLIPILKSKGYRCIEIDQNKEPNTTVVYFPVKEKYFDRSKFDVSMWEQLENVAQLQQYWSDNQVSATITFNEQEANDIKNALELYEVRLKGISFLPLVNHGYEHAPYQEITKEEYEEAINQIEEINSLEEETHEVSDKFCDGESCQISFNK